MQTTLKHIASIQTGIYAQTVLSGEIIYLQSKHFNQNGEISDNAVPDLPLNDQTEKHLLNDGDILFTAKGSKNFATKYKIKTGYCVASSAFLVIRLIDKYRITILPEYLCWFINNPRTQEWIKAKARGSSILSIAKSELQELEISIPSLEKQEAIVKIDSLQKTEQNLLKNIQLLKEQYIQNRLNSAIK